MKTPAPTAPASLPASLRSESQLFIDVEQSISAVLGYIEALENRLRLQVIDEEGDGVTEGDRHLARLFALGGYAPRALEENYYALHATWRANRQAEATPRTRAA